MAIPMVIGDCAIRNSTMYDRRLVLLLSVATFKECSIDFWGANGFAFLLMKSFQILNQKRNVTGSFQESDIRNN
jgi:hypothetical protein